MIINRHSQDICLLHRLDKWIKWGCHKSHPSILTFSTSFMVGGTDLCDSLRMCYCFDWYFRRKRQSEGFPLCHFYHNISYSMAERFLLQLFQLYTQGLEKQSQVEFEDYLRPIQANTSLSSAPLTNGPRRDTGFMVIRVSSDPVSNYIPKGWECSFPQCLVTLERYLMLIC